MGRHLEDRSQLHLFERATGAVTVSRQLAHNLTQTRALFEDAIDPSAENNDVQSKANTIIALSDQHPLSCFAVARALIDIGVVPNAYNFSIGTEDDCLMMVMDRERGNRNFMERALQHIASMREGDAQTIRDAWNLLTELSTQEVDNLTCAERIAAMHFQPTEITPPAIRKFWARFRKAYSCFRDCVEAKLTTSLPILHMIADGTTQATTWQEASSAWRGKFAVRGAAAH
jgi:hypothetical protein